MQGDWKNAQVDKTREQGQRRSKSWQTPDSGWIKVNVDAATNVNDSSTGLAFIVKDERGNFVATKNMLLTGVFTLRIIEVFALKEALN